MESQGYIGLQYYLHNVKYSTNFYFDVTISIQDFSVFLTGASRLEHELTYIPTKCGINQNVIRIRVF